MMRLWLVAIAALVVGQGGARGDGRLMERFRFDGARCITEEEHLGIVGGRLSAGIGCRTVGAVQGVWAPPVVSSDLRLDLRLFGRSVPTHGWSWLPAEVRREGALHGIAVSTTTVALHEARSVLLEVELRNTTPRAAKVPVEVGVDGSLDRAAEWGFPRPASATRTTPGIADGALLREAGGLAIAARVAGAKGAWDGARWSASVPVGAGKRVRFHVVLSIGPSAEAQAECARVAGAPGAAIDATRQAWERRAADLFARLPRLEASDPRLTAWYNRSLVHLLTNRWDVPEFLLHPYYATGSVKGGCVCSYLWNYGEVWEILPLYNPAAVKTHVSQFLKGDIGAHFAFDPISGEALGPWYPVNQEKIVGSIYYYVLNTGDVGFLSERAGGKTVLEWVVANAMLRDDPRKPVALIDYGPSNSHLELRRGYPYNHVMPDLNGRRYLVYEWASRLCEIAGEPKPRLMERAAELKRVLKEQLWDPQTRWFRFLKEGGVPDTRYTMQMYKLIGSGVLDADEEAGLLSHLNEREFLSAYGFHSMSKLDPAYDQVDIDNGGGGVCTSFPHQIIEKLCRAGRHAEADDILERILWWGERMPYWGDSIVANEIDYRKDTPLQCTLDGAAGAQAILFGLFGVRAEANGDIVVNPHAPAFSARLALRGLRLRGQVLDISVSGDRYEVRCTGRVLRARVGVPTALRAGTTDEHR